MLTFIHAGQYSADVRWMSSSLKKRRARRLRDVPAAYFISDLRWSLAFRFPPLPLRRILR